MTLTYLLDNELLGFRQYQSSRQSQSAKTDNFSGALDDMMGDLLGDVATMKAEAEEAGVDINAKISGMGDDAAEAEAEEAAAAAKAKAEEEAKAKEEEEKKAKREAKKALLASLSEEEKKAQETYLYHQPHQQETAYKTLEKLRDSSLFDSNQDLIKGEIERLVAQTVQIGPVQA